MPNGPGSPVRRDPPPFRHVMAIRANIVGDPSCRKLNLRTAPFRAVQITGATEDKPHLSPRHPSKCNQGNSGRVTVGFPVGEMVVLASAAETMAVAAARAFGHDHPAAQKALEELPEFRSAGTRNKTYGMLFDEDAQRVSYLGRMPDEKLPVEK